MLNLPIHYTIVWNIYIKWWRGFSDDEAEVNLREIMRRKWLDKIGYSRGDKGMNVPEFIKSLSPIQLKSALRELKLTINEETIFRKILS